MDDEMFKRLSRTELGQQYIAGYVAGLSWALDVLYGGPVEITKHGVKMCLDFKQEVKEND